ncbi:MAG: phosphonate metabolism protein PhnP [Burkholderiaceae bacterium]|jgi:phosphoribosyl 1,2-cyclic phosphate phosphodiesterase
MKLTLLGTGNAAQVPVYNCGCVACARARVAPPYRRQACSALLQLRDQTWLIDGGLTDLTERFAPGVLTGILQTHYHADHAMGLLHLRWGKDMTLPVLGPADPEGLADLFKYPGILDFSRTLQAFDTIALNEATLTAVPLNHSRPTLGYVVRSPAGSMAYLTDTVGLPPDTTRYLQRHPVDVLVIDCSYPPQPAAPRNHNDLTRVLDCTAPLPVKKVVLTHIGHEFDNWLMTRGGDLPGHITVARDADVFTLA